jgi:transcription termination/antitermination protein NusG
MQDDQKQEDNKVEEVKAPNQDAPSDAPKTTEIDNQDSQTEAPTEAKPQHAEPEEAVTQPQPTAEELIESAGEAEVISAEGDTEATAETAEPESQPEETETSEASSETPDQEAPLEAQADETKEETTDESAPEPIETTQAVEETPQTEPKTEQVEEQTEEASVEEPAPAPEDEPESKDDPNAKWYVVHTYAGHENKVATGLKQRIETEHLEHKILDILVPTQDKIEIRGGKKETVKEKIFPGYILVKMILDDASWLAVRTTQGVTSFVGMGNKPTPISEQEVKSIVQYMSQGAPATFKDVFLVDDTVKIIDGPFADFIGKVDTVDKEKGKVRVLVSIFGRETPVELDFLQVQKL